MVTATRMTRATRTARMARTARLARMTRIARISTVIFESSFYMNLFESERTISHFLKKHLYICSLSSQGVSLTGNIDSFGSDGRCKQYTAPHVPHAQILLGCMELKILELFLCLIFLESHSISSMLRGTLPDTHFSSTCSTPFPVLPPSPKTPSLLSLFRRVHPLPLRKEGSRTAYRAQLLDRRGGQWQPSNACFPQAFTSARFEKEPPKARWFLVRRLPENCIGDARDAHPCLGASVKDYLSVVLFERQSVRRRKVTLVATTACLQCTLVLKWNVSAWLSHSCSRSSNVVSTAWDSTDVLTASSHQDGGAARTRQGVSLRILCVANSVRTCVRV